MKGPGLAADLPGEDRIAERLYECLPALVGRSKVRLSRCGAHWFDRLTGLNVLLDEVDIPADRWSWAPRYLSLALTNACELVCAYCYAPKIPGRLRAAQVSTWLKELDAGGCLGVGFGGGEPTAHPDFTAICREAAEQTRLAISFTTHGHRVDRSLADSIRGSVHFVRVSVDGVGPTYERLRGRSFEALLRRLDIISTIAPFGLNVVVNDATLPELDAVVALASKVGASELLLLPQQPARGLPGLTNAESSRLERWIAERRGALRLAISRAGATDRMPLADPFGDEPSLDAHAHIDAMTMLKPHAYATHGVPVVDSVEQALDSLRRWRAA